MTHLDNGYTTAIPILVLTCIEYQFIWYCFFVYECWCIWVKKTEVSISNEKLDCILIWETSTGCAFVYNLLYVNGSDIGHINPRESRETEREMNCAICAVRSNSVFVNSPLFILSLLYSKSTQSMRLSWAAIKQEPTYRETDRSNTGYMILSVWMLWNYALPKSRRPV